MGPQNPDPNNPSNSTQPDLSSVLGSTPQTPNPTTAESNLTPSPQTLPVEPASSQLGTITDPLPSQVPAEPAPLPQPTPPASMPEPEPPLPPPASVSPLDNPLGVPPGEPQLDGGGLNAGFNWSTNPTPAPPLLPQTEVPTNSPFDQPPPTSSEPAPTDLSQLANTTPDPNVYTSPIAQPETLVVPPATSDTTIQAESSNHGIPKWMWIAGAALLLVVIIATAYFILGIGRQAPAPQSLPATEGQQTLVTPPVPSPTPVKEAPTATSSGGFNQVGNGSGTQTATSAADILKQKLQK